MGIIDAFRSLGANINKQQGEPTETQEGVVSEKLPELSLNMDNDEIIELTRKWKGEWDNSNAKNKWLKQIEANERYWLGKHTNYPEIETDGERAEKDNLIFEALEVFLPQATRRNPEPLVILDSDFDEENEAFQKYVERVKKKLADLADKNKLRLKLKKLTRYWALYQLGVVKVGWDLDRDIPTLKVIRPQKLILDPNAVIDEDGYNGERIGEYRELPAYKMLAIMKDYGTEAGRKKVEELTKGDKGTLIRFIEWWTPEYSCWELDNTLLMKMKMMHWNYDKVEEETKMDEYGVERAETKEVKGTNHFATLKMPYVFLSVFNLGDQPMDNTSLINQNLANQDLINRRNKQITKNAESMNNGMVVSGERSGLTEGQSAKVTKALRKGGVVWIPSGSPREAMDTFPAPALPNDLYNQLADTRNRLRDIFGVSGSSQAGIEGEKTVRGKIISRGLDTDRIGGGVTEYLEQFADDIYNWFVQLLYVYDTGFQFIGGAEPPKLIISVKEGSLLPKDSTTIANQALELAGAGRISNVDLFKRLEYPNPEELAANVWLEVNAPHILYKDNPEVMQALGMMQAQQAMQGQPQGGGRQQPAMEGEEQSTLKQVPMQ